MLDLVDIDQRAAKPQQGQGGEGGEPAFQPATRRDSGLCHQVPAVAVLNPASRRSTASGSESAMVTGRPSGGRPAASVLMRAEERRARNECVSTGKTRWSPLH